MPIARPRPTRRVVVGTLLAASIAASASAAQPAFFQSPPTVITNVRVLRGDGTAIERATVVVRRGRVAEVVAGDLEEMPRRATVIDGAGRTLTPGLIDVHSRLAMTDIAGSGPLDRAADAFDRFDADAIREALAHGVTTVYLPALGSPVSGTGIVVRLGEDVAFVDDAEALHLDLGSDLPASRRLEQLEAVRKRFADARAWRQSVELYQDELLPDYEKKLTEAAESESSEEDGGGDSAARGGGPSVSGEDLQPRPIRRRPGGGRPGGDARGGRGGQSGQGGDGPKKPAEPRPDRAAEVLLRAIDGDLPVRVAADRSADILNAIDLAEQFGLRLVIEGGSEAHLVAEQLAAADAAVVLRPMHDVSPYAGERFRSRDLHAGAMLTAAGVRWASGTGGPRTTRFVLLNARLTAAHTGGDPLVLATRDAAAFLGLDGEGVIRPGARADLVLWTSDPLDPSAVADRVWVDGRQAYERETE
ncbi:MAG: amidohydrolase family protein [Planctomycetota bacterium]|jgi:imidazolonepropionase-like amidohydrolase